MTQPLLRRRAASVLGALFLTSAAGCAAPTDDADALEHADGFGQTTTSQSAMVVSNPATHTENSWCLHKRRWNGVRGRIYYPPSGGCSDMPYSPLVVLLHGKNYGYNEYNVLLKHLARNGFVAVSIDTITPDGTNDHSATVDDALDFMDAMRNRWSRGHRILLDRVGLIGHSRGGDAVRALGEEIASGSHPWTVRAAVGLSSRATGAMPASSWTDGFLVLQGTHDGDQIPERGFRLHDLGGTENSIALNGLDRVMKLVDGAAHPSFTDRGGFDYQDLTKGYVLAFLASHLQNNHTWYEDYIRHDLESWVPATTRWSQYSDGVYRTVIDNAEHGGVLASAAGSATVSNVDLANTSASPHLTRVMRVRSQLSGGTVTWSLPNGGRNAGAHDDLSLRIGQISGAPAQDLSIQIRNGGVWSPSVTLETYDAIAQPTSLCSSIAFNPSIGNCDPGDLVVRDHMATVRIPLDDFGPHDDVEMVRLRFQGDAVRKYFYVDNLEFSGWVYAP